MNEQFWFAVSRPPLGMGSPSTGLDTPYRTSSATYRSESIRTQL